MRPVVFGPVQTPEEITRLFARIAVDFKVHSSEKTVRWGSAWFGVLAAARFHAVRGLGANGAVFLPKLSSNHGLRPSLGICGLRAQSAATDFENANSTTKTGRKR